VIFENTLRRQGKAILRDTREKISADRCSSKEKPEAGEHRHVCRTARKPVRAGLWRMSHNEHRQRKGQNGNGAAAHAEPCENYCRHVNTET
jgi:hypothetical protein